MELNLKTVVWNYSTGLAGLENKVAQLCTEDFVDNNFEHEWNSFNGIMETDNIKTFVNNLILSNYFGDYEISINILVLKKCLVISRAYAY